MVHTNAPEKGDTGSKIIDFQAHLQAGAHLRKGVASAVLRTILDEARARRYTRLSLETGSQTAFAPARALYARFGFTPCGPFAAYTDDPNSVFMTREL